MSDDNVVSIKDFYNQDSRITIVENAIVSIDKRFDKIDNDLKDFRGEILSEFKQIRKEMKSDYRWLLTIIAGLGAIMAHGFHWF